MVRDWLVLRQHGLVYPCGPRKASGGSCMEDGMSVGARSQPSSSMPHPAASWATMGSWTLLDRTSTPADSLAPAKADALTCVQLCFSSLAHSLLLASTGPDRCFVSVCKTDTQELQCLWSFMLQLTPHKVGVGQLSRNLRQALSVVVRTSGWMEPAGWKGREKQLLRSQAVLPCLCMCLHDTEGPWLIEDRSQGYDVRPYQAHSANSHL